MALGCYMLEKCKQAIREHKRIISSNDKSSTSEQSSLQSE